MSSEERKSHDRARFTRKPTIGNLQARTFFKPGAIAQNSNDRSEKEASAMADQGGKRTFAADAHGALFSAIDNRKVIVPSQ